MAESFSFGLLGKLPEFLKGDKQVVVRNVGELFTIQGAAEKLGLSYWVVYGYVRKQNIPTTKVGNTIMVHLSDLSGLPAK